MEGLQASRGNGGSKTLAQIEGKKFSDTLIAQRLDPLMYVEVGLAIAGGERQHGPGARAPDRPAPMR
jgi:hypothetical protein